MYLEKIEMPVDMSRYPLKIFKRSLVNEITIGDMHANSLKILYFLILVDILKIKKGPSNYLALKDLYEVPIIPKTDMAFYKKNVKKFSTILQQATINPVGLLRFIGDLTGDRGNNDLYTLIILEKLNNSGIKVENILSNHDMAFISAMEHGRLLGVTQRSVSIDRVVVNQMRSTYGLQFFLKNNIISESRLEELYAIYRSTLNLFSYTPSTKENELIIFTHAPVGIECIYGVFVKFYADLPQQFLDQLFFPENPNLHEDHMKNCSSNQLMKIMDQLNKIFRHKNIGELILEEAKAIEKEFSEGIPLNIPRKYPIFRLCWNRSSESIEYSNTVCLQLIHGHELNSPPGAISLDNALGKNSEGGLIEERYIEQWYSKEPWVQSRNGYRYGSLASIHSIGNLLLSFIIS